MPHTSAGTDVSQAKGMEVFCENLRRYFQDEPLVNVIDWQRGYEQRCTRKVDSPLPLVC
jgi:hypothetical protein